MRQPTWCPENHPSTRTLEPPPPEWIKKKLWRIVWVTINTLPAFTTTDFGRKPGLVRKRNGAISSNEKKKSVKLYSTVGWWPPRGILIFSTASAAGRGSCFELLFVLAHLHIEKVIWLLLFSHTKKKKKNHVWVTGVLGATDGLSAWSGIAILPVWQRKLICTPTHRGFWVAESFSTDHTLVVALIIWIKSNTFPSCSPSGTHLRKIGDKVTAHESVIVVQTWFEVLGALQDTGERWDTYKMWNCKLAKVYWGAHKVMEKKCLQRNIQ